MYSPIVSSSSAVVVPSSSVDAVLSSLATPYSRHRWMPCHLPRLRHALLSWYHTLCCRTYPPRTTQYPSPSHLSNHTPLALLFSFDCCIHHRSVCCLALALFIWHCHPLQCFIMMPLLLPVYCLARRWVVFRIRWLSCCLAHCLQMWPLC